MVFEEVGVVGFLVIGVEWKGTDGGGWLAFLLEEGMMRDGELFLASVR